MITVAVAVAEAVATVAAEGDTAAVDMEVRLFFLLYLKVLYVLSWQLSLISRGFVCFELAI